MESSAVSDVDLIYLIKSILESRAFPINYKNLRELVREAPPRFKTYVDSKYTEEKFLNFLLSNSNVFSVSPDGSVVLIGAVEYILPQCMDVLDSIPASDDSYFGDREEYISDSEEDSNASMDSDHQLLSHEVVPDGLLQKVSHNKPPSSSSLSICHTDCCIMTSLRDSTSSSDSTPLYLSSDSNSGNITTTSTESDSQSSFESCNGVDGICKPSDACSTTSSSYSSCSDS